MNKRIVVNVPKTDFKKNDVLIYDGKDWYVITKEELFAEFEQRHADAVTRYDREYQTLRKEFISFKSEVSDEVSKLATIMKNFISKEQQ